MKSILHIANNSAYSDNPISNALRDEGFYVKEIDFVKAIYTDKVRVPNFNRYVIDLVNEFIPDFVFMQIQHAGIIDYETAYHINQISPLISFSGDVRNDTDWHERIGASGALILLNNDEDIDKLRSLGHKADYLQISFHPELHNPIHRTDERIGKVVFIGNNYGVEQYPLSKERIDLVKALKNNFGHRAFGLYGIGWESENILAHSIPADSSSYIYSCYDIAVNHSHYQRSRYSSDRLFYILASGTFCLTQWYPRIEEEFIDGEHLVIYHSINDLIKKCNFWLRPENADKREEIALKGCDYVHSNCTWNNRIKSLKNILNQYYPYQMTKNDNWVENLKRIRPEKRYSQFGDEAYIMHIFSHIGTTKKYFVDLGAGDGKYLSNTKMLKDEFEWKGLMVDADNKGNDEVFKSFITAENIIDIFKEHKVPKEFDFLSIDLDGNDYYVLSKILDNYRPRLIVAEFNGTIPVGEKKVMKYNPEHVWDNDDYYGASFESLKELGAINGYNTIFSIADTNIYMVSKDLLQDPDKDWQVSYVAQQYHPHNPNGEWVIS